MTHEAVRRIRRSEESDLAAMLAIINDAAQIYRGVIPADRWHEPYMPREDLAQEIAHGVEFWVAEEDGRISGVMGIQDKGEVALVRHAYVVPTTQRSGIGTRLLRHCGKPRRQADPHRNVGGRLVGGRFLSAQRLHRSFRR